MSKIKIFSLGGLNENGKNMYVVEVDKDIFVFDAGLKFENDQMLGVDYILPDYSYLKENKKRLKGFFLTHGHESNMGAMADILADPDMNNINVYGTKFTLEMLKRDLNESGVKCKTLKEIRPHSKIAFGKNSIFPISVTHSIPDAVAFVLYTKDGAIVYTGDFVFDSTMMGNYKTDIGKLAYVGKQGVLCLLSESIYAEREGHTSPNNRVYYFIKDVYSRTQDRVITTVQSSHIYRLQEILYAARKNHKKVIIMGKPLQELINKSIDLGYLDFDKTDIGDLSNLEDKNIVVLVADEKEKPYMNLERIIRGFDKYIKLKESDVIFVSEPPTDGNEKRFALLMDELAMAGVNAYALNGKKHLLHHASREDLMLMINLMNPKYYFPVRGEYRHQVMNGEVAEKLGIPKENIILKQNGDVAIFENGKLIDDTYKVPTDEILIDGKSQGDIGDLVLKDREMLGSNGIVIVSCTIDKKTKEVLCGPEILTRGFVYVKENGELLHETQEICLDIIEKNIDKENRTVDFNNIKNDIRNTLGKHFYKELDSKPMIITVVQEV